MHQGRGHRIKCRWQADDFRLRIARRRGGHWIDWLGLRELWNQIRSVQIRDRGQKDEQNRFHKSREEYRVFISCRISYNSWV